MTDYNPEYCSIDLVKDRLLIAINDTTYDEALHNAVKEASRIVDMFLRAYTVVPLTGGVGAGEQITNGDFETGNLTGWESQYAFIVDFEKYAGNYSVEIRGNGYIKQIFTTPIPKSNIVNATLYYYNNGLNYLRLTIGYSDNTSTTKTLDRVTEWTIYNYLDDIGEGKNVDYIMIKQTGCGTLYVDDVSLITSGGDYPEEIKVITADFGASIFKRRMMPEDVTLRGALQPDQINQIDATGWFALGLRKLEQYIKSKYIIQNKALQNAIYNPELYIELFNRGLITGAEVRQFIVNPDVKIVEHKETYQYSRQKKFKVIKGKTDSDGYEVVSNE
jgi:hypothetical protein